MRYVYPPPPPLHLPLLNSIQFNHLDARHSLYVYTCIYLYYLQIRQSLRGLPDLERALARVHAMGSLARKQEHPDGKAIMYENTKYGIRTVKAFITVLEGFERVRSVIDMLSDHKEDMKSNLLKAMVSITSRYNM